MIPSAPENGFLKPFTRVNGDEVPLSEKNVD
jgi:hypothetical protein